MRACARARARACVRACVCARVRARARACVSTRWFANVGNSYAELRLFMGRPISQRGSCEKSLTVNNENTGVVQLIAIDPLALIAKPAASLNETSHYCHLSVNVELTFLLVPTGGNMDVMTYSQPLTN